MEVMVKEDKVFIPNYDKFTIMCCLYEIKGSIKSTNNAITSFKTSPEF